MVFFWRAIHKLRKTFRGEVDFHAYIRNKEIASFEKEGVEYRKEAP